MTPEMQEFVTKVQSMIRDLGASFTGPEDDWFPAMFIEDEDGNFFPGMVDPRAFESDEMKEAFSNALPRLLAETKAVKYALLMSAWMLQVPDPDRSLTPMAAAQKLYDECDGSLSEHPDRTETLILSGGSDEEPFYFFAPILRDGEQPPALGAWEEIPSDGMQGRFAPPTSRSQWAS